MLRGPALNLLLLLATAASVFATNYLTGGQDVGDSALFTVCVLLILGSHELGHYFLARHHGVAATLPYFIPAPFISAFGTLGAVIRLKGRIPNRNALVDIGAAGPLAGLAIAVPLLVVGMWLSQVAPMPQDQPPPGFPGSFSLWNLAAFAGKAARMYVNGDAIPNLPWSGGFYFGDNALTLLLAWLRFDVSPTDDVWINVHPVYLAAWFGMLVTMLNLIPVGQLDGGHLTAAWLGPRAVTVGQWFAGLVLILALLSSFTWLVFFFLATRLVGFEHPPVVDEAQPLSAGRKVVCVVTAVFAVLTFMPLPIGFM